MQFFLHGKKAVPMIIAKRYVTEEPKVTQRREFVGFRQGFGTLVYKAIELVQECFWDEKQEVEDPGDYKIVNYIVDVVDDPGQGAPELVVRKLDGEATPGCGIYCHMIYPQEAPPEEEDVYRPYAPTEEQSRARMVQPKRKRPDNPLPPPQGI